MQRYSSPKWPDAVVASIIFSRDRFSAQGDYHADLAPRYERAARKGPLSPVVPVQDQGPGARHFKAFGLPVEKAIELADSVGGLDISVSVSMGTKKGGLITRTVKKCAELLVDADATHIKRLVLNASEDEDVKCQHLDLLKARVEYTLELANEAREIDRADCQRQLVKILKEGLPAVEKRKY